MDHAGHAAFETLRKIEFRLEELLRDGSHISGLMVACEILKAIREARGEAPSPDTKEPAL